MKLLIIILACLFSFKLNGVEHFEVVTEEFPPFSYTENEELKGFSTEIVRVVLKEARVNGSFKSYPWIRSYKLALENENVMIYSLVKTDLREKLFKWVGPISYSKGFVYKLKDRKDIHINSINDIAQYNLGLVRGSAISQKLLSKSNFNVGININLVNSEEQLIRMLKHERIDLIIMAEPTLIHRSNKLGEKIHMFEKAYLMNETQGYLGVNKLTSDKIVKRLQNALDKLKQNGVYERIHLKYFPK